MRRSPLIRMRSLACLILLLAFGAGLLPTHSVSAQEQTVVVPKEEMQVSLWQSWWRRAEGERRIPQDAVRHMLIEEFSFRTPAGDTKTLIQNINTFTTNYKREISLLPNPSYEASIYVGLLEAAKIPAFKSELPSIAGSLLLEAENGLSADSKEQIATGISLAFTSQEFNQREAAVARRVVQKAKDPQFAATYDEINKDRLGASITELDDVGKFIRDHSDAAIPPKIVQAMRADGSVAISLAELNEIARTEFGKINASIDDLQQTVGAINAKQDVLVDYVLDQRAREEAQVLAAAKAEEHRLKLQVAQSYIGIAATLASYIDPERGYQISVVGNSLLQIADAYTGWTKAVAGLGTLDALTSLSTAAMTGNVISAALQIFRLFGPSRPTPEQMILEQIGKLREQVSELRSEMHDRFDRVDQQLNTIYATLQDRFDKIDLRLGKIDGNIQEIQQTLVRLEQTLSRIERNSYEFLDATNRRPLLNAINGALAYKERTGLDMPYQPDFLQYENDFHSWGTIYAFDALSAGPMQRDYHDEVVAAELNAYPLDVNINYLNSWLQAHGIQPFANKRLPGPRDWLFASRAYTQLSFEWPAHASKIRPERQAALDAVGNELEQAMHQISTRLAPDGPQGNDVLFDEIVANYTGHLDAFDAGLQATQAAFVQQQASDRGRSTLFDLYGGVDQVVNHIPAEITTMTCGDTPGYGSLPAPYNLKNIVPEYNHAVLADYLKVHRVKVCLGGLWMDPKIICSGSLCQNYALHRATIAVYVGNTVVARRFIDAAQREVVSKQAALRTIDGWEQAPFYKAQFEAQFANATAAALSSADVSVQLALTTDLENALATLQQAFDQRVKGEMSNGGLKDETLRLVGAKKLLESFVALGMP